MPKNCKLLNVQFWSPQVLHPALWPQKPAHHHCASSTSWDFDARTPSQLFPFQDFLKEWLKIPVSTKSSFVKLYDCVWCYLSPPSPQPSLVPHNLSFVLNDEIGSFFAAFIGNTINRHHSCHCRRSPLLEMSIRIRILRNKCDCRNSNQTKIGKRREKMGPESE